MSRPAYIGPTPRESEVLSRLLVGKPDKVIAYELGISARTVQVYAGRLLAKMHATCRRELIIRTLTAERDQWKAKAIELQASLTPPAGPTKPRPRA